MAAYSVCEHMIVWCDLRERPIPGARGATEISARQVRYWCIVEGPDGIALTGPHPGEGLRAKLTGGADTSPQVPRCILWLPRGWTDLVCAGLTEHMESGAWACHEAILSGARVLLRGKVGGQRVDATSLALWTGGDWTAWRAEADGAIRALLTHPKLVGEAGGLADLPPLEYCAVGTVIAIIKGAHLLECHSRPLTAAALGRAIWRSWLGPRVKVAKDSDPPRLCNPGERGKDTPAPILPDPVPYRRAARHVCYGMVREQYARGLHDAPVHVYDLSTAYLRALLCQPLPICAGGFTANCTPDELSRLTRTGWVAALVYVEGAEAPVSCRVDGRTCRAIGDGWTWLCGVELVEALWRRVVTQVARAYCWRMAVCTEDIDAVRALLAGPPGVGHGAPLRAVYRSAYSALVGQFATWGRRWVRRPQVQSPVGPWGSWERCELDGQWHEYRAWGGRVETSICEDHCPWAAPALFAAVTSWVRHQVDQLREALPPHSVLATVADALWLTEEGGRALDNLGEAHDPWASVFRPKASYARAWLDGRGGAVVESQGQLYAQVPGVPMDRPQVEDAPIAWEWVGLAAHSGRAVPRGRVLAGQRTFDARAFARANGKPLVWGAPWYPMAGEAMREELLLPLLHPTQRRMHNVREKE